jgi:hypothetical protein
LEVKSKNYILKSIFFSNNLLKMRLQKMSKRKFPAKTIVVFVTILFIFSFLPTALACKQRGKGKVTYRPIEDWLDYNPYGCGPYYWTAFFGNDMKGNHYWAWFDGITAGELGWEYNYKYSGHVREKLLPDGSIEYKVILIVKDLYIECLNGIFDDFGYPWYDDLVLSAYIDFMFQLSFTLDATYPGFPPWEIPAGTREPGCRLPDFEGILMIPDELGIHLQSFLFVGSGSGDLYEPGWTYDMFDPEDPSTWPVLTGETAHVNLFHYATFDEGDYLELPFGSSGFKFNTFFIH